jgi:hypothetical protein
MIGVIYKSKPHKLLNGTLFYCYEYCQVLRQYADVKLYLTDTTQLEFDWLLTVLQQKYITPVDCVVRVDKHTDLYALGLSVALVLDINTLTAIKDVMRSDVVCFSNEPHTMWRPSLPGRSITYFGIYDYQPRDVDAMIKLKFDIHAPATSAPGVYVSSIDMDYIAIRAGEWARRFDRPVITKRPNSGRGNIYDDVDWVHYVHTGKETNNRTIPEAFWHGKNVTFENPLNLPTDSAFLRYNDILTNGLQSYMLTDSDEMIQACLKYCD